MKNETDALSEKIAELSEKRDRELVLLKKQFSVATESLNPINLIKSTFHEVTSSPEVRNDFLGSAVGLGTGFLSRKIMFGSSHNPVKRLLGTVMQFAITNVVSKHADDWKTKGRDLLLRLLKNGKNSNGKHPDYNNNLS